MYDRGHYKSARTVIHMLADIVSKNGNLLLNIPVRGDGSIDSKAEKVVEGIAAWMKVNGNALYATRPWRSFGEGPASVGSELSAQGFNEGKGKPFGAGDVRYTASKDGKTLHAIVMGVPDKPLRLTALGRSGGNETVRSIALMGGNSIVSWEQHDDALVIQPPRGTPETSDAIVYKISL
jgi:alpha-L-fucosidase